MEDRYLCKAKRTDTGEWVEGNFITNERDETKAYIGYLFDVRNGMIEDFDIVEVVPATICQCTGLKDKNGKLIWENDIVKRKFRLFSSETKYEEKENCGVIKYDEAYARFGYQCSVFVMLKESEKYDTLEVIGNIFDNPELLEVGE